MQSLLLFAAVLAQTESAQPPEGSRRNSTVILSTDEGSRRFQEQWGYSDAIVAGDFVFLSGVVASMRQGEASPEPAFTRAFAEIGAILGRLDCSWGDVVDISSFHTDLTSQMPAIVAVKRRHVGPPFPAWTAVGVTRLIPNSGIAEIKVTAMCKARRPVR